MNKINSGTNLQRFRIAFEKKTKSFYRTIQGNVVRKKIFFLHIPKCGGTSVDAAIQEACRWKACAHLNARASRRSSLFLEKDLADHRKQILAYLLEQQELNYISGHFLFDETIFNEYSDRWNYVTMLRNPVDKYLSQYFYNRQKENQQHFGINEELETYIETEEGKSMGSDLVHRFSGLSYTNRSLPPPSARVINQAVENLKKFILVGFLDEMEQFKTGFRDHFGATLSIKQMNRNPGKKIASISGLTRKKVEELCEPDLEFYHQARKYLL
jgi:hypothetical protein